MMEDRWRLMGGGAKGRGDAVFNKTHRLWSCSLITFNHKSKSRPVGREKIHNNSFYYF